MVGSKILNTKSALTEEKKQEIIKTLKDNTEIWEDILLFKKVDLKEIKKLLTKEKIIIGNDVLKEFVTSLGVVLSGGWN